MAGAGSAAVGSDGTAGRTGAGSELGMMASATGTNMGRGACSVAGCAETAGAGSASVKCMSASTTGASAASGSEAGPGTSSPSCNCTHTFQARVIMTVISNASHKVYVNNYVCTCGASLTCAPVLLCCSALHAARSFSSAAVLSLPALTSLCSCAMVCSRLRTLSSAAAARVLAVSNALCRLAFSSACLRLSD